MRFPWRIILTVLLAFSHGRAADKQALLDAVRSYRSVHEHQILTEFVELLSIPNVSSDAVNVRRNAGFIRDMLEKRGVTARVMETAGNPVVFGEKTVPGATRTLMFYIHYDGQPVDATQWIDSRPFEPTLRPGKLDASTGLPKPVDMPEEGPFNPNWRIYARGTSDDRAPIIAMAAVLDALFDSGLTLKNNIKFILDGEEEAGSPNLGPFLQEHRDLLDADVLFMCDGPGYYSGDPTLFFGVRGITGLEVTVYGANTNLHSGHYGNWAPNPAMRLAKLLDSMKDENGRVLVDGFYDTVTPLSERERAALDAVPPYDDEIKALYGFSGTEGGGRSLLDLIHQPSLNVRGIRSGWVGEQARTIVPDKATASMDIRLVKGNDPEDMVRKVVAHIRKQGYHVITDAPDAATRMAHSFIARIDGEGGGYAASRTSMDLPISRAVVEALTGYSDRDPVLLPTLGGSLPLYLFEEALGIPLIGVPIANHDNNQHQANENIRIGHLWRGMETFAALLMME